MSAYNTYCTGISLAIVINNVFNTLSDDGISTRLNSLANNGIVTYPQTS